MKQIKDVIRVENAVGMRVREIFARFQLIALRRLERGDVSFITQQEIDQLRRVIAAGLAAADDLARKRVRRQLTRLSFLDDYFDMGGLFDAKAMNLVNDLALKINDDLRLFTADLIQQGLPTQSMKLLLQEKLDALGLSPRNSFSVENIVRTQAQIVYGAAKYEEEQQDYVQEILWGYKYVTVGDVRVRPEHARLEGVTLPKDDPFWQRYYPPNGWSCRCQAIPLFEKEKIKRPRGEIDIDPRFAAPPTALL